MALRTIAKSFSAGELTPELFGRADFAKFQEGLALCNNFITLPHGPAVKRPGTSFVKEVKDSTKFTRLIPFSFNSQQTFVIEMGAGWFRWHTLGGTLIIGGEPYSATVPYVAGTSSSCPSLVYYPLTGVKSYYQCLVANTGQPVSNPTYWRNIIWSNLTSYIPNDIVVVGGVWYKCLVANLNITPPNSTYWTTDVTYEIANSYAESDLADIHYVQSSDVLTFVHPNYQPMELRRYANTNWQLVTPTFNPPSNYPISVTAIATVGTGSTTYDYVVTSIAPKTLQESSYGTNATCTNDLTVAATPARINTITWVAPTGATPVRYNVYRLSNGVYGYIGQAGSTSFIDQNIIPNIAITPPSFDTVFASNGNYPSAVSYHEQRRCFAGTTNQPQNMWMTRSGTESDMSYSIPSRDDNRISFRIAAREASAIKHIVPMQDLILLTASGEWKVSSVNSGAITPSTISVKPQSYNGSNNVTPVVIGNKVLFCSARGGHVRELSYNWQAAGFVTEDISLLAPHLFDYGTITDMAYCRGSIPIVWCISSQGNLLGCTYVPEQGVVAWHQHDTQAGGNLFQSLCSVTENGEDVLYVIVGRGIGTGAGYRDVRYIERLHTRKFTSLIDAFYVDCGTQWGPGTYPAGSFTGDATQSLVYLEHKTVTLVLDGKVYPNQVVTGGAVTLPIGCSYVTIGIPITAEMITLPVAAQIDPGMAQGRPKNVNKAWIRMYRTGSIEIGPNFVSMQKYTAPSAGFGGEYPEANLTSEEVEVVLNASWGTSGQIYIRSTDPMPLDITSLTLEVAIGG